MIWQDIVIAVANLMFTFSLVGQVYHGFIEKRGFIILKTSGLTSIGLYAISVTYYSLILYSSAVISFINASLWGILFFQRIFYQKAEGEKNMKTMKCKELGGPANCLVEFTASSFEEIGEMSKKHGMSMMQDPAHQEAMKAMMEKMQDPEEFNKWYSERRKEFEEL